MKTILGLIVLLQVIFSMSCENKEALKNANGITFTRMVSETSNVLDGNIVNYSEILGYDSINYVFLLSENAGNRIRKKNYPVTPTKFAITLDGELIYIANFIPGYSSMSCFDCITVEPYSYDNKYRVVLGYPGSDYYFGNDPRNDRRIIARLKRDNKLLNIEI